ncbi:MAG TPA: type II toxin-antitoxin system VapC family toxin [Blastocatellia bacterium]|nr:type II toxin-antitoxin system VapC family toxin [Blastocatellia bacterium]
MAAYFFDTSALGKYYLDETGSDWVEQIIDAPAPKEIIIAEVTGAEIIAAFTRRSRQGRISLADAAIAIAVFKNHFRAKFHTVVISSTIVEEAMRLAEIHGLRGYDSIQLACALAFNEELITLGSPPLTIISADAALNLAAQQEGLMVDDPNNH